jgi:site-specific recombinase XerD
VAREQGLCLHDLAFMRAVVQGQTTAAAALRYLPEVVAEGRVADRYLRRVGQVAADTLVGVGEPVLAKSVLDWLRIPKSQAKSTVSEIPDEAQVGRQAPSLDEFAEAIGAEDFSEREILALFQERYGDLAESGHKEAAASAELHGQRAARNLQTLLRALAIVQTQGLVQPKATDPLSLWLTENLALRLGGHGAALLGDLVAFVNGRGRHWYRHVPGIGQDRARRLVGWLVEHEECLGQAVSPRSRWDNAQGGFVSVLQGPGVAGTQLEAVGGFSLRSTGANAAGASDDAQALKVWLETLTFKAINTQTAYARDAQRLLYWARERGKTLSTLTVLDAAEHARFLLAPPDHWIERLPTRRRDSTWRPMRGALSRSSAARALAAIGHLYGFLVETGYLVANPFSRIRRAASGEQRQQIDTTRSFGAAHLQALAEVVDELLGGPAKRRARALLLVATTTGVRIGEFGGTWGDVVTSRVELEEEGAVGDGKCLRVVGKGGKERLLPLKPAVLLALERHLADRRELEQEGLLPALPLEQTPLVSVLERPVGAVLASTNGALSAAGIHRIFKSLYRQAAKASSEPEMRADFERATAHWLRHTFAHTVLRSSGGDLPVTQQLLGHASLATTGIYIKADMGQRFRAVLAMPLMFDTRPKSPG